MFSRNSNALLRACRPVVIPNFLPEKGSLERHHPGIDEHQRGIGLGHDRRALHPAVATLLEEFKEVFSYFTGGFRHVTGLYRPVEASGRFPGPRTKIDSETIDVELVAKQFIATGPLPGAVRLRILFLSSEVRPA